jgi:hypothetical protein
VPRVAHAAALGGGPYDFTHDTASPSVGTTIDQERPRRAAGRRSARCRLDAEGRVTAIPAAPGAYFQALGGGPVLACDRRVRVWTWRLAVERPGIIPALGLALAAAHVPSDTRMRHPQARVAPHLAPRDSTARKGDFGEFLTAALYSGRMGEIVPFEKLSTKPVGGATQQGTDVLTLTPVPRSAPEAVVVEVKTRPAISHPKADLDEIAASLGRVTDEYLESAWRTAVRVMEAHPDHRQSYALPAAISLAKLDSPAEPGPDHARNAAIVTGKATLTAAMVTKYWGSAPPVTDLHVIVVPDLIDVMNLCRRSKCGDALT